MHRLLVLFLLVTTSFPARSQQTESVSINKKTVESLNAQSQNAPWYLGAGGGVSFGRSTFVSFAMDKTHPASNFGVLGGYTINNMFSAEATIDWTRITLGTYDCCRNLWLGADGNRYFAPLSGAVSYKYSDLISTSNLLKVGARFNIDLLGVKNTVSKWSALVSPVIFGVQSNAEVNTAGTEVRTATAFHLGTGLNLGVGYDLTPEATLRLTTGIDYLTGAIDGLPREEHKTSYVWNNALQLIVKLQRNEK